MLILEMGPIAINSYEFEGEVKNSCEDKISLQKGRDDEFSLWYFHLYLHHMINDKFIYLHISALVFLDKCMYLHPFHFIT